jgi:L-alanine-DL-glutamate epimerase-like enolase superfamily enzyme
MLDGLQYAAGDLAVESHLTGAPAEAHGGGTITSCNWTLFCTDETRTTKLPALEVLTQDGARGCWVGDYLPRHDPAEVRGMLARLAGRDCSAPEELWEEIAELGFPHYLRMAVDIAAWDRYGRAAGKPVARLLGPARRDKVALYVAGVPQMSLEENVETARQTKERGIGSYKIYTYLKGYVPDRDPSNTEEAEVWLRGDISTARAVREAVGDSLSLMFYNGRCYHLDHAIHVGKVLDELGYAMFYDPMPAPEGDSLQDYIALQQAVRTPVCAPIEGGDVATRVRWMEKGAVDMNEIDVYAGFTPCLQLVRACEKAGVPLDLHGGFPNDFYQFPLYGMVDDAVLPRIGWHHRAPQHIPVATEFHGSEPGHAKRPWVKRMQARPVDADGFVHLCYEIPGMGVELAWDWIRAHEVKD